MFVPLFVPLYVIDIKHFKVALHKIHKHFLKKYTFSKIKKKFFNKNK